MSNLFTIVLDAGHGGAEKIGGSSPNNAVGANGLLEKNLTLDIARRTAMVLKDAASVLLTRNADVNLSLAERADIARRNNASLFLSIHFNGFRDAGVDGVETFVASKANPRSEKFAQDVLQNLVQATKINNRGIRFADLGVLLPVRHSPQTAACLAEIAFLTNPAQAGNLENAAYRQQIAVALGDAILKNLPTTHTPQSFSFDYEDDLDARHFQPLDAVAFGGDPVFDIKKSVGAGGVNLEDDVFAVKKRLIEFGFDWLTLDKRMTSETIHAIKLFQSIVNDSKTLGGDGKIEVGKTTHKWLQAVNAPRWQKMPKGAAGEGFVNYEYDDENIHIYGTDWLADALVGAGIHYRDNYLKTHPTAALLTVNDASLARGGVAPPHGEHQTGMDCDIRLPRTDGRVGGINISRPAELLLFDRDAARAILQALKAQSRVSRILFNDQTLVDEGLCKKASADHNHHIHVDISPPARGAIELNDLKHYHSGNRLYQGSYQDDIDYQTHALDVACNNTKGIGKDQKFVEFKDMKITSDLPSAKEKNVFLRWNNIPANACEIDVVVHFHGFDIRKNKDKSFFEYVVNISGLDLKDRIRPTLCILPFGINDPKYKEWKDGKWIDRVNNDRYVFPFFNSDGGLQKLIDESLKTLKNTFTVGRLILAAHSGGGKTVAEILKRKVKETLKLTKANGDIDEVHLFDATYSGTNDFINWSEKRIQFDSTLDKSDLETKGGGLRVLYLPFSTNRDGKCVGTGTTAGSKAIEQKLIEFTKQKEYLRRCYRVEPVGIKHLDIPNVFGFQLLRKGFTELKVLKEHSSSIDSCCKSNPKCGITTPVQPQSLAYYDEDKIDYFANREASFMNY